MEKVGKSLARVKEENFFLKLSLRDFVTGTVPSLANFLISLTTASYYFARQIVSQTYLHFMTPIATISFLGTGSGIPSANRFFSSALFYFRGIHLLIDAGEPCVHLLRDRGNLLQEIDAVLITHGHVDHIGGVPALLQGCMLLGRTKPLPIYLPEEMIAPLRTWISALYLTEEGLGFPVSWNSWKNATLELLQGTLSVTPHCTQHLDKCYRTLPGADPTRPCHSYSLEIVEGEFRVLFSGDLAQASDLTPLLSNPKSVPMTVLICEMAHFSALELVKVLRGAPVETLCLVHLSEENAENRSELKFQMEELLPEIQDVIIPEDGEVLDF